jgi:hypothetical protein
MKERPILFSGPMVRAIIEGRKTQTRRAVRPQPELGPDYVVCATCHRRKCVLGGSMPPEMAQGMCDADYCDGYYGAPAPSELFPGESRGDFGFPDGWAGKCPYGAPGDLLYVRETWQPLTKNDRSIVTLRGQAGGGDWSVGFPSDGDLAEWWLNNTRATWRPSIHMPKWAARIWLRVTDVRVERVQDISEEDCDAEGLFNESGLHLWHCSGQQFHPDQPCACGDNSPEDEFGVLWDSINAKRGFGWDVNPWVWVVSFERCEKPPA